MLVCVITVINGYPILYSDTSTYLASGFELETPFDRPITYGLLLRVFSLNGTSLLFVPIFQAIIYVYVLDKVLQLFTEIQQQRLNLLIAVLALSIFTGFNWDVNQLIADIFTALGFLCLVCILFKNTPARNNILLFVVFFISAASHISNIFLYFLILAISWLFKKYLFRHSGLQFLTSKILVSLFLLVISYFIMASAITKSKDIFFNGSLAQKGILQEVLKDKCDTEQFKLCQYKDSIPMSFEAFVWKPESPLYKLGGWKKMRSELNRISSISMEEKKYITMQAKATAVNFNKQIITGGIGDGNGAFGSNTILIQRIQKFAPLDKHLCLQSKQASGHLTGFSSLNLFYWICTIASVLIIIIQLLRKKIGPQVSRLFILTLCLIFANFALVAFSSEVSQRHSLKVYWLFTLICWIILLSPKKHFSSRRQPITN